MNAAAGQRTKTVASDTVETFLLRVVLYGVGLGASVLISRSLGPVGRGIYYLPVVTAATVASIATLGIEQANVFLFGTRGIPIGRLWSQGGFVALTMGTLAGLLLVAAPAILPQTFGSSPPMLWWLMALGLPFALHAQFAANLLTLRGEGSWQFRAGVIAAILQTCALVGLFLAGWLVPETVVAVLLGSSLTSWVLIAGKLRTAGRWVSCDLALLQETLAQSLVLHVGMMLLFLHLRVDMFMLSSMAGLAPLGIYSLSVTLAESVMLATDSVAIAILSRQMGNSLQEAAIMALRAARISALLSICLTIAWAVVGFPLISVTFGGPFAGSFLPLLFLLPGITFMGMQRLCGGPVLRAGVPSRIVWINVLSLACNVVLNLWWIPLWGATGAGAASTCSYALGGLLFLRWTAGIAGAAFPQSIMPGSADATALWRALTSLFTAARAGTVTPRGVGDD